MPPVALLTMPSSTPQFTPAQWDTLIDRFLASGLTQTDFCQAEGVSRHCFTYRYRRSEKFVGIRKGPPNANKTNEQKGSGFRTVQQKPASVVEPLGAERVSIHIGHDDIRLHCSATVCVEAIVRLVREARS